ncbi:MAG: bifunctional DNA-formamidopyrimidine glycosylase/DNA-(apurinic or apyrimidinic site) lyase, partial [Candidatus Hydrogenedentes bacterium]|nr:bifunctional DNA-formamidopyrimidine glycosylase/DNA-(apurinic or apyrimidinic site) lyase [Candidatus Hydrogenedentota bacterium]
LTGRTISQVKTHVAKSIQPFTPRTFSRRLKDRGITGISRRAKVIVIALDDGHFLLVHLKMTGQLLFVPAEGAMVIGGHPQRRGAVELPNNYTRAEFYFTDGAALFFNDLRKFGWLRLVTAEAKQFLLAQHGIEPLSRQFTLGVFQELMARYPNRTIKQTLLDQKLVAGLGNIYVDEACFMAGVLPTRRVVSLSNEELARLHREIVAVLRLSIRKKGTSARNYLRSDGTRGGFMAFLNVYGRGKEPCRRCGQPLTKIQHAGRGTHFCMHCQK